MSDKTDMTKPARVRVAPSPTGHMHLATARTALYDYLLATTDRREVHPARRGYRPASGRCPARSRRSWTGCAGWGLSMTKARMSAGRSARTARRSAARSIPQHARILVERGMRIHASARRSGWSRCGRNSRSIKQPSHYDGLCRRLDPDEARRRVAAGERHVIRFKMPKEGTTTRARPAPRRYRHREQEHRRLRDAEVGWAADLSPGGDGGRPPDGDHARDARRRMAEHVPAARERGAGVRVGGAGVGASLVVPEAERQRASSRSGMRPRPSRTATRCS